MKIVAEKNKEANKSSSGESSSGESSSESSHEEEKMSSEDLVTIAPNLAKILSNSKEKVK
jgi:hypothetical protein